MRFCIIGAGAIGSFVAARLALGGEEVTVVARGSNLEAIGASGLRVRLQDGREERAAVRAVGRLEGEGPFDAVIITLKAHQVGAVAGSIEALCHDDTVVLPMQNGVPFWYFHGQAGPHAGRAIEAVDPAGMIRDAIVARRVLGCVVYIACERVAPGVVAHNGGNRIIVGEIDAARADRVPRLAAVLERCGLQCPPAADIRAEVWVKLWGNLVFNPISALTHASLAAICADAHGRSLAAQMMREAEAVASRLGVVFRVTLEQRIDAAARVGAHKTSMLQDVEAGRAIEVDALVGAVAELARLVGVETPTIDAIYRATKLLEATMRAGPVAVRVTPLAPG